MRRLFKTLAICFVLLFNSCSNTNNNDEVLTIFAASSLRDVLSEISAQYEKDNSIKVKLNFASSGTLARQISQGAEVDVFVSANNLWTSYLDSLSLIKNKSIKRVAGNSLVIISNINSDKKSIKVDSSFTLLKEIDNSKMALADPNHVPLGMYSKQALTYFHQFENLENNIIKAKDARSTLMLVELDEVALGLVYKSDALRSGKVKILAEFSPETHKEIRYEAAICKDRKIAEDFYLYLNSNKAKLLWEKYSFDK